MAGKGLVRVGVSLTTLDAGLSRQMEPRAPSPARRLQMIRRLTEAGIPVRVDGRAGDSGADRSRDGGDACKPRAMRARVAASWIMLRLPREVSPLFRDWLATAGAGPGGQGHGAGARGAWRARL